MFNLYRSLDAVECASSRRILLLIHVCLAVYVHLPRWENVSICPPACVCVCALSLPALKHQQQITDGPPALEVFYFPAEARYVKNKHVQH